MPEVKPWSVEDLQGTLSEVPDDRLRLAISQTADIMQNQWGRNTYNKPELEEYYKTIDQNNKNYLQALQGEVGRRDQLRADMARIASERTQIMQQQDEEMKRLQAAQIEAADNQAKQAADLKAAEQQQQQQLAQARVATNAATTSTRLLQAQPATKAPTAQVTRQRNTGIQRSATGWQTLRIGATSAASGAGLNIGG